MKIERTVDKNMNTLSIKCNGITISEDMSIRELSACIYVLKDALDKATELVEELSKKIK